jgi:hypothetical protein
LLGRFGAIAPLIVAGLFILSFYVFAIRDTEPKLTGDEPHYLAFAGALSQGSLDVRAAYTDPSGPSKWFPNLPTDQTVKVGTHLRSIRTPLLPLLLAPAMAVSSLRLVFLTMMCIAVAFFDQLWRLLTDLGYRGAARAVPWLVALTALPVLGYTTQIYPEIPGALAVVVVLRLLVRNTRGSLIAASAVAGLLPWLIVRFALLGAALSAVAVVMVVRPEGPHAAAVARALKARWRDGLVVSVPFVFSMVLLFIYLKVLYGTFNPGALYPPAYTKTWTLWHAYEVGIGSLVGASEGLLPYAPGFIIALMGVLVAGRRYGAVAWVILGAAALHLFVIVPMGFFGLNIPGRFAIVLVPLLVLALAEAVQVAPPVRFVALALIAVQLLIVGLYSDINGLILDRIPHYQYLLAFPNVLGEPGLETFQLAGTAAPSVGGPRRFYNSQPLQLRPGNYRGRFELQNAGPKVPARTLLGDARVVQLPSKQLLATRPIRARDLARPLDINFRAPGQPLQWTNRVVLQLDTTGATGLTLRRVSGRPTSKLRPRGAVERDALPLGLAWVAGIALGAVLLLTRGRRARLRRTPVCDSRERDDESPAAAAYRSAPTRGSNLLQE